MKKLVPSVRSRIIMMALTNNAGKASSARTVAMKMPHTTPPPRKGPPTLLPPSRARLKPRPQGFQPAQGKPENEKGKQKDHRDVPPPPPRRAMGDCWGGEKSPAGPGGPAGHEEARHE